MHDVLRIQEECYVKIEPESRGSLQAKIVASPATCLLAESADGVVGYLIAVPVRYPDLPVLNAPSFHPAADADTLYIHDLAVAAAGRGTGAGRALVLAVLDAARSRGLASACLVAIQDSVPFWQQFGFEVNASPPGRVAAKLASYGVDAQMMQAAV